jgi:hypothetical protein
MKPAQPQQHPEGRTLGLTEEEIAKIRLATESSLWRYHVARWTIYLKVAPVMVIFGFALLLRSPHDGRWVNWMGLGASCLIAIILFTGHTYDWFSRRRLGRQLGYG